MLSEGFGISLRDLDGYTTSRIQMYIDSGDHDTNELADDILAGTVWIEEKVITVEGFNDMLRKRLSEIAAAPVAS